VILKRSKYEDAGVASYWVIDPDERSLLAWDLTTDGYIEVARASGLEQAVMERPFPVRLRPADLVSR
jgi:Uma2 family endonuclease